LGASLVLARLVSLHVQLPPLLALAMIVTYLTWWWPR
jgi:hypothetical protein